MISLKDYNEKARQNWLKDDKNDFRPDIACPECGSKLTDTCLNITLDMYPPLTPVHCKKCKLEETRVR